MKEEKEKVEAGSLIVGLVSLGLLIYGIYTLFIR